MIELQPYRHPKQRTSSFPSHKISEQMKSLKTGNDWLTPKWPSGMDGFRRTLKAGFEGLNALGSSPKSCQPPEELMSTGSFTLPTMQNHVTLPKRKRKGTVCKSVDASRGPLLNGDFYVHSLRCNSAMAVIRVIHLFDVRDTGQKLQSIAAYIYILYIYININIPWKGNHENQWELDHESS